MRVRVRSGEPIAALALGLSLATVSCWGGDRPGSTPAQPPTPVPAPPVAEERRPSWLSEVTAELGIDFVHHAADSGRYEISEVIGSGLAAFDIEGDGDLDLYFLNGNDDVLDEPPPGRPPTNRLYRQEPDGRFVDVSEMSGLADAGHGSGVAVGDLDNDGDLDVYLGNHGADRLYRNRGDGTFEDVTEGAGLPETGMTTSVAFFDHDGDGLLDVHVTRYVEPSTKVCFGAGGRPDYCGPLNYPPVADLLLRNEGDGRFADVSESAGLDAVAAAGLGVTIVDFDRDGRTEVYVANDGYANHLWRRADDGRLREEALLRGVAYNALGHAEAGMGVVAEDLDGDDRTDLFVTHLRIETNTYYRAQAGGSRFRDVTGQSGLGASSMDATGFGVAAFDIELDGDLDLAVANGRVYRLPPTHPTDAPRPWDWLAEANLLYLNDGSGVFSLDQSATAEFTGRVEVSRGLLACDLDGDGDEDLIVTNIGGPARVYRNGAPRRGSWLAVRAIDPALQRDALGASVTVEAGERSWTRTVGTTGSYLTSHQPTVHFGLGRVEAVDRLWVRWPHGPLEEFPGTATEQVVLLRRGEGQVRDDE